MRILASTTMAVLLVADASAFALERRLDHAGQVGLRLAAAGEWMSSVATGANPSYIATLLGLEGGPSVWIDEEGDELSLRARFVPAPRTLGFYGGFRKFAGADEWKTFLEGDVVVTSLPSWFFGLRIAAGLQWDPVRPFGAFASVGVAGEMGESFRFRFEACLGVQVRLDI